MVQETYLAIILGHYQYVYGIPIRASLTDQAKCRTNLFNILKYSTIVYIILWTKNILFPVQYQTLVQHNMYNVYIIIILQLWNVLYTCSIDDIILITRTKFHVNPLVYRYEQTEKQFSEVRKSLVTPDTQSLVFVDGRIATSSVARLEQNGKQSSGPVSSKHFLHLIICSVYIQYIHYPSTYLPTRNE